MTTLGMTAGLATGMILAAFTFVVNAASHLTPVRGSMPASTLRSSRWRGVKARDLLNASHGLRRVLVHQLQGHLYFANLTQLTAQVEEDLAAARSTVPYWFVVLDFTLVLGIDSSASFALLKLVDKLSKRLKYVVFVTGKDDGFPCTVDLSSQLETRDSCVVAKDLDAAIEFLETTIISAVDPSLAQETFFGLVKASPSMGAGQEVRFIEEVLQAHCPGADAAKVKRLAGYFKRRAYKDGDVVWKQFKRGDRMLIIVRGR